MDEGGRVLVTQITLSRLPRRQAAEMTGRVAHGKALPPEVVEQVVAKTDGVPLFVEELTKMVLESDLLQERAAATMALATEHDFPLWCAMGTWLYGWALAEQGQEEAGMVQIRQGLTAWRATGAAVVLPTYLATLAEVYGKAGQWEDAPALLREALALVEDTGERGWEAELYRLQGVVLLQQAPPDASRAAACFQQALNVAGRQRAKSLELRAAMSLSWLWQGQGKRAEACELLAPVYGWFTEGFDTADLQEAKALLDELAG